MTYFTPIMIRLCNNLFHSYDDQGHVITYFAPMMIRLCCNNLFRFLYYDDQVIL